MSALSLTPRSPARFARRALGLAAVVLPAVLLAAPAQAATESAEPGSSAVVTRLTVDDGRGWVTVQVRLNGGKAVGFEISVPAGSGTWGGAADVAVRELGLHCRLGDGPDLHYTCGNTSDVPGDAPFLPSGGYQVTLPVTHTGALPGPGLTGAAWVDAIDGSGAVGQVGHDSFPVVDSAHFLTTAEVRSALLVGDTSTTASGTATVPVTVTVVPGERVASVDVTLTTQANWSLTGTNALPQGVWCNARWNATGTAKVLHCAGRYGAPLPPGRYQLVSTLRFTAGHELGSTSGAVAVTMVGGTAEPVDSFGFTLPSVA